jgi:hypothetical protein
LLEFLVVSLLSVNPEPLDGLDCHIERRSDGALLVRVTSAAARRSHLPDAVFAFRLGDPQFGFWQRRLAEQEAQQSQQ